MLFVSFPSNSFCFKNCIKTDDSQLSYTLIISHDKINIVQFSAHFLLRKNIWQLQENTELFKDEKEKFKWTKKNVDRGQNREWGKTGWIRIRMWNGGKTWMGSNLEWGMGENPDWITAEMRNGGKPGLDYRWNMEWGETSGIWNGENLHWIPAGIWNVRKPGLDSCWNTEWGRARSSLSSTREVKNRFKTPVLWQQQNFISSFPCPLPCRDVWGVSDRIPLRSEQGQSPSSRKGSCGSFRKS